MIFFFFSSRRRHTRSDRDWSSDVCSSDLRAEAVQGRDLRLEPPLVDGPDRPPVALQGEFLELAPLDAPLVTDHLGPAELGDLLVAEAVPPAAAPRSRHARLHRQ